MKADTSRMFRSKWQKQFQWKKVAMYVEAKTSHQKSWPWELANFIQRILCQSQQNSSYFTSTGSILLAYSTNISQPCVKYPWPLISNNWNIPWTTNSNFNNKKKKEKTISRKKAINIPLMLYGLQLANSWTAEAVQVSSMKTAAGI